MTARRGAESPNWSQIHDPGKSWRAKLTGDLNESFILPRFVEFFYSRLQESRDLSILEVGAGMGDISRAVLAADRRHTIGRYLATEKDEGCVEWLKKSGLDAIAADGMALPFESSSFDVCVEFDVLHHAQDPRKVALEMMRVARGRCLMTESNGLSVFRKLRELTPGHRKAGERSYTPATWRSFFEGHPGYRLTRFEIFPFLFPVPSPKLLLPAVISFNRAIERTPFFRWQCSNVGIYLEFDK